MDIWGKLTSINRRSLNLTEDLSLDTIKIGRSENNQIVIEHPKISKVHCIITRQDDGVYIEDKSSNGTYIQNSLIGKDKKVKISSGDIIYLLHQDKIKSNGEEVGLVYSTVVAQMQVEPEEQFNEEVNKIKEKLKKEREQKQKIDQQIIENYKCSICQDIIHDYVQLNCCMHGFCGGCLSQYLTTNQSCPDCRMTINYAFKNPNTNQILEVLKKTNKVFRYPEEYEELDLNNVITSNQTNVDTIANLFKKKTQTAAYQAKLSQIQEKQARRMKGEVDSDYSYQSENEDEEDQIKIKPEECPECKIVRQQDQFKCSNSQAHESCTGCKRMFPDRPERTDQRCILCKDPYCGLYLGVCRSNLSNLKKPGKHLSLFKDFKAPQNIAQNIFRNNKVEIKVFQEYLKQQKLTNQDILDTMNKEFVSQGKFTFEKSKNFLANYNNPPSQFQIQSDTPVCSECFPVIWYQIVLKFRIHIKNQLPGRYSQRPNCHWGINCTTQTTKDSHAETYDHICEQSRFK